MADGLDHDGTEVTVRIDTPIRIRAFNEIAEKLLELDPTATWIDGPDEQLVIQLRVQG